MASVFCLAAMMAGVPGLMSGGVAALAYLEGSHQVVFHEGESATEVVLQHDGATGSRRALHHQHCLTAKMVVLLAERESRESDHVVKFTGCRAALKSDSLACNPVDARELPAVSPGHFVPKISPVAYLPSEHAPPTSASLLLLLRSTVLVI